MFLFSNRPTPHFFYVLHTVLFVTLRNFHYCFILILTRCYILSFSLYTKIIFIIIRNFNNITMFILKKEIKSKINSFSFKFISFSYCKVRRRKCERMNEWERERKRWQKKVNSFGKRKKKQDFQREINKSGTSLWFVAGSAVAAADTISAPWTPASSGPPPDANGSGSDTKNLDVGEISDVSRPYRRQLETTTPTYNDYTATIMLSCSRRRRRYPQRRHTSVSINSDKIQSPKGQREDRSFPRMYIKSTYSFAFCLVKKHHAVLSFRNLNNILPLYIRLFI